MSPAFCFPFQFFFFFFKFGCLGLLSKNRNSHGAVSSSVCFLLPDKHGQADFCFISCCHASLPSTGLWMHVMQWKQHRGGRSSAVR